MKPASSQVAALQKLSRGRIVNPSTVAGLNAGDPPVPTLVLGWNAESATALAMVSLLKNQGMTEAVSPCSGWNMFGRDDLLSYFTTIAEEAIDAAQTQLTKMDITDLQISATTVNDAEECRVLLEAVDSKQKELKSSLSGEIAKAALQLKSFVNKHRDARQAAEWLEKADHFTKDYMIELKKKYYMQTVDFWTQMAEEFKGKETISVSEWRTYCMRYFESHEEPFFDFLLQGMYNVSTGKLCRVESLLRQTQIGRDKSAPFNDILWLENSAPDFWKKVKAAEVTAVGLFSRLLFANIPVAPSLNVTKSEMVETIELAMETPSKVCRCFEIKENQPWTEKTLIDLEKVCNRLRGEGGAGACVLLDDCNETGNNGFWDADRNDLHTNFIRAMGLAQGVKLELAYIQAMTVSLSPIGQMNKVVFEAIQAAKETQKHEWYDRCHRLATMLKACKKDRKIVVFEMTLNGNLSNHAFFISHMSAQHSIEMCSDPLFEIQGDSGYGCAFTASEWAQVLQTESNSVDTVNAGSPALRSELHLI